MIASDPHQNGKLLKVLHTPKNPSGLASHLVEAERELGYDSNLVTTRRDFTDREADKCYELQDRSGISYVAGHLRALRELPAADVTNLWYGATYVHWPRFGASLVDLGYLARRSRIFATYVGSDARRMLQRGGAMQRAAEQSLGGRFSSAELRWLDSQQRRSIEKMAATAEQLFAVNPDLFADLPAEMTTFLPYPVRVERAVSSSEPRNNPSRSHDAPLRVLHAPSNAPLKGSVYIDAAMERITSDLPGKVDYRRVGHLTHQEFVAELAQADVFVDQLLIGWYGVSSVEAMLLGVAPVCFIEDADLGVLPAGMAEAIPVLRADPSSIESVIRSAIDERDRLAEISAAGVTYAAEHHAPSVAAAITSGGYAAG